VSTIIGVSETGPTHVFAPNEESLAGAATPLPPLGRHPILIGCNGLSELSTLQIPEKERG
jgi:hypothetical protein